MKFNPLRISGQKGKTAELRGFGFSGLGFTPRDTGRGTPWNKSAPRGNIDAADGVLPQFAAGLHSRGLTRSGLGRRSAGASDALKDTAQHRSQEGEQQDRQNYFKNEEAKHGAGAER